ncbi:putative colanic acid biosynthesis acetyltransferase [Microbulbifer aestuariivivens]|uniref:putative colanic acid biosynthesis acetyltransferase n=1 Tax=Microbulbifer aestuariivivens TaxID=1908308 RepID=UPI0031ED9753
MYQDLSEFKLYPNQRGKSAIYTQIWWLVQSTLFGCSPRFMYGWRRFLLRAFGAKVGKGVIVRPSARVTYPWRLELGDNVWIGDDVDLYNWSKISVLENAVISQRSYLCTATHDYEDMAFKLTSKPIKVSECAWVATDVFIAPGVTIGCGAVVGARSSVFKDMPAGMICIGNPAQPIKKRVSL